MKIYLVRHGQSAWQLEATDNLDAPLTKIGEEQSKRLAAWVGSRPHLDASNRLEINGLNSSPLRRSKDTALQLGLALSLPVEETATLSEAVFHVAAELPQRASPAAAHEPFETPSRYAVFKTQAGAALDALIAAAENQGGPVLAVTHGGLIKTLLRVALDSDRVCFRTYNCGLSLLEWRRGRWHLVYLNLLDHLPSDLRTL